MIPAKALAGLTAKAASASLLAVQGKAGGPDILGLALITMGAIFAAALVGLGLYLVRLRIGFWLHRPPAANPNDHPEHH